MSGTDRLIDALAADMRPVRPLRPPLLRAVAWLLAALAILALITALVGVRPTLAQDFARPAYRFEWLAALATGLVASVAAFHVSVPGRSRLWLVAPWIPFAVWVGAMGHGCLTEWVERGPDGIRIGTSLGCFLTILLSSLPLGAVMLLMVRHAGPVLPTGTATLGGLAVAALSAANLSLHHDLDVGVMVVLWHLTAVLLVIGLARGGARRLFAFVGLKRI